MKRQMMSTLLLALLLALLSYDCSSFELSMSSSSAKKKKKKPPTSSSPLLTSPVRVVKCFPNLSRRQADQAALDGRVRVDGKVVPPSYRLSHSNQILTLDNKRVDWKVKLQQHQQQQGSAQQQQQQQQQYKYYRYNKPTGVTCTMDVHDRRSLAHHLPKKLRKQHDLFPVGRLDLDSHGLVLLTNHGTLANALLQPSRHHEKEYHVVVQPALSSQGIQALRDGVVITTTQQRNQKVSTAKTNPCQVVFIPNNNNKKNDEMHLCFVLTQGRNRQIRKMIQAVGSHVVSLQRVRQGNLQLGRLPSGAVLPLEEKELQDLLKSCQ